MLDDDYCDYIEKASKPDAGQRRAFKTRTLDLFDENLPKGFPWNLKSPPFRVVVSFTGMGFKANAYGEPIIVYGEGANLNMACVDLLNEIERAYNFYKKNYSDLGINGLKAKETIEKIFKVKS